MKIQSILLDTPCGDVIEDGGELFAIHDCRVNYDVTRLDGSEIGVTFWFDGDRFTADVCGAEECPIGRRLALHNVVMYTTPQKAKPTK